MKDKQAEKLLELVKHNYQEIAAQFDATRKKEIWPEIREFAAKIKEGDAVLDLGCGNGRLVEAFLGKKISYLGLDNSLELIKLAQKNYPENKFVVGDILELKNIPDNNYDYVFCLATLQHIPTRELRLKSLRLMANKIKDDGEIIISNWNMWGHKKYRPQLIKNYWLKLIGKNKLGFNDLVFPWKNAQGEKMSDRYYHAFTKKELKKLTRLAKLKLQVLRRDKYNYWLVAKKIKTKE
jgi:ubiquinone/menaquinone biosynthesis C-methylase UbiE